MNETLQQLVVFVIVLLAVVFLVHRFTGWPKRPSVEKGESQPAVLGDRLARGLEKAKKGAEDR